MAKQITAQFNRIEIAALAVGFALLVTGVFSLAQSQRAPAATGVKEQSIPMTLQDFQGDPAIQNAIQKQLGGDQSQAQTPQATQGPSPQSAGADLQAATSDLQARPN